MVHDRQHRGVPAPGKEEGEEREERKEGKQEGASIYCWGAAKS